MLTTNYIELEEEEYGARESGPGEFYSSQGRNDTDLLGFADGTP